MLLVTITSCINSSMPLSYQLPVSVEFNFLKITYIRRNSFIINQFTITDPGNRTHTVSKLCEIIYTVILSRVINHFQYRGNLYTRVSSNSEAFASELLDNLEEMFLRYYMHSDVVLFIVEELIVMHLTM